MSTWRAWAARGRHWACGLAAALLVAQVLGLAHHVLHGGLPAPGGAHGGHAHEHHASGHEAGDAAFPGHEAGGAECRLIDALAGGDALPVHAPVLPAAGALQAGLPVATTSAAPLRAAAPYEARAPPQG